MSDVIGAPARRSDRAHRWLLLYARTVAMLLLAAGLWRASRILGMTPDGVSLISLAPAWRAATVALAFIGLFAAVGLWIGAAWGPVMWAVALGVEISMHTLFADLFGPFELRIALHAAIFVGFLLLAFLDWRRSLDG